MHNIMLRDINKEVDFKGDEETTLSGVVFSLVAIYWNMSTRSLIPK